MRRLLLVILTILPIACGGENKPAVSPTAGAGEAEKSSSPAATKPMDKPKVASKYPEPFLEPDCAEPAAEGYLPDAKKAIADVRKKHWSELEACAEAAPEGEPLSGEIRTSFRLDPDGVPRCVEAPGAPSAMQEVVRCVLAVYRTFRFPKPKNGSVRVTDGIHLQVSQEDED
jgi:hypothetical protein